MIVHSTFTNGYLGYAKLFLDSFKSSNGSNLKIVFTTTDLTNNEIEELKVKYENLIVHNKKFDYEPICTALGITEQKAKNLKWKVEHENARKGTMRTKWKMHVAAENRVKIDIPFVMNEYKDLVAHFDIDMYFKKSLAPLFKIMRKNDFTVMYRPHLKKEWRKIWMCAMGIKKSAESFIKEWGDELDKIPLKDKPFAYGQTSCYRVYKRFKKIQFGNIPEHYILAGVTGAENALIVSGNKSSVGKDESLERFKADFNKRNL